MQVQFNKGGLKIILPRYKITIKEVKGCSGKTSYQYSCILPPVLCSFFNIKDNTVDENAREYNSLIFYKSKGSNYIMSWEVLNKAYEYMDKIHIYNMTVDMDLIPPVELVEQVENIPLNINLFDEIRSKIEYSTMAYKLTNSNSYRVTLPNHLFKDMVNPAEDNYIQFIIDTSEDDLLTNKAVVKYTVER